LSLKKSGKLTLLPDLMNFWAGCLPSEVVREISGMKVGFVFPLERVRNIYNTSSFSVD